MDNWFRLFQRREVAQPSKAEESQKGGGNWQSNVVHPFGRGSLLIPTWNRCVSLLMQTMGQMVVQYQSKNRDGGNFIENTYGANGDLNYLLQRRPNPIMTASQMQEQIEFRKIYFGNAYVYIERRFGVDPIYMWLCTDATYDYMRNIYTSVQYSSDRGPIVRQNVPASDVLHFKNVYLSDDFYTGIPTLTYAFKALSIAATGDEQALQDMAKGGKMKLILSEDRPSSSPSTIAGGTYNKKEVNSYADEIQQRLLSNDVVALQNLDKVQVISQTAQQLQLLEQRGYSDEAICRLMGVPKIMAMIGDGGSYKMPEHATQEFLLRAIQPRIREHEDEYNSKLLNADDFGKRRIHICEQALRRLDPKGQADIDKLRLEAGTATVNELRKQYDMPAVENGDEPMASANLLTLKALIEKNPNPQGGRPTTEPKPTEE